MKKYIEDTIKYYDNNVREYFEEWHDFEYSFPERFLNYLKPQSRILDLGCGTGRDSLYFKNRGHEVVPVDGSIELCKIASQVLEMPIEPMNFLDIDFDNEFDGVFATASLLHLNEEDLVEVLKRISKALKANGVLYASFKKGEGERQKGMRFFNDMTEERFTKLCEKVPGLEIIEVDENDGTNNHSAFINFFLRKKKITD